jgi:hypothetical protein
MVNVAEPGVVGVPAISPVVLFKFSPAGSAPAVTVNTGAGVPDAVTRKWYAAPAEAVGGVPDVNCGLVVLVGIPGGGHPVGTVIVLVSRVTAAVEARSRPAIVAPVVAVIDWSASIVPWNCAVVPNVAELPTCQKTLQAVAPPEMRTFVPEPIVSVLAAWKTHTELALPARVRVPLLANDNAPPEYTPGVKERPLNSLSPDVVGVSPAATLNAVVRSLWA